MGRSNKGPLADIQQAALDPKSSLALVLRKCIALGGEAGSAKLRDWARNELDGYRSENELPEYRRIRGSLCIDASDYVKIVRNRQISIYDLPEFARDALADETPITYGVGEIEKLADQKANIQLQDPRMPDLVRYMNSNLDNGTHIHSLYWQVSPIAFQGILDRIRTIVVALVAEMQSSDDRDLPSPERADQAVSVVIEGAKRSPITVNLNQNSGPSSDLQAGPGRVPEATRSAGVNWLRRSWTFTVGAAGIVAAIAGAAVWAGWNPFG